MAGERRPPLRFPPVVETIDEAMVPILAAKTGAERLAMAFEMGEFARRIVTSNVRATHPDWDGDQVTEEAARLFAGGLDADFLAPYEVIVKNLVFYREGGSEKLLRDVAGVLLINGSQVDHESVARWAEHFGVADAWRLVLDDLAKRESC